jgi:hypothetical protein
MLNEVRYGETAAYGELEEPTADDIGRVFRTAGTSSTCKDAVPACHKHPTD